MKKRMILLAAALLLVLIYACSAGAESQNPRAVKIKMDLSSSRVQAGDTVHVEISITNASDSDFTEPVTLYYPNGKQITEFGEQFLKIGESASWAGDWTVAEKQLADGRITFAVRYTEPDENGAPQKIKINFSKKIAPPEPTQEPTPEPTPEPDPTPEPRPEDFPDVILYGVYRPNPSTGWVAVGCVDTAGDLWIVEQADVPWPCTDEGVRKMLSVRRGMKKHASLIGDTVDGTTMNDAWFATDVPAMVDAIPQPTERPRKTGIDVGQEEVRGLRKTADGKEESVLLGMDGSYMYENPSPDAQRLCLFMWRLMSLNEVFNAYGAYYGTESVAPAGFRGITVREFYGLADGDFSKASVSAVYLDAEGGPAEKQLTPEETEELRTLAERGMIIRKENRWSMPEDVLTCTFTDEQGKDLGQIRLFTYTAETNEEGENILVTLAAADDGMYQTALMPRPVDVLTEEEQRMLTVAIEGVDYIVGKSTPRDLIRNGWPCFPEIPGTLTFEDPEMNNTIVVWTAGGSLDEPIQRISCQFAYEADISWCGFDGILDPANPNDPDWGYLEDAVPDPDAADAAVDMDAGPEGIDPEDDDPEDDDWQKHWIALSEWVDDVLGADQDTSEPGTSVCYPLSDGRYLYLYSANSPIVLSLSEYGPEEDTW